MADIKTNGSFVPYSLEDPNIKYVMNPPPGFVDMAEFAKRTNCGITKIRTDRQKGVFPYVSLRWVKVRKARRPVAYIDWPREGNKYISTLPPERWPLGFNPGEEVEVDRTTKQPGKSVTTPPPPPPEKSTVQETTENAGGVVASIAAAKLKQAQLDIEKRRLELAKANNEVLEVEVVANLLESVAATVKATLLAIPPRLAPILAAEDDVPTVYSMIEQEVHAVLEGLQDLEKFMAEDPQDG